MQVAGEGNHKQGVGVRRFQVLHRGRTCQLASD